MKKLFLTGISLLFAASLTFAQSGNPEDKAKEKVEKLAEKLTLTEEQQTAVHDIVLEHVKAKEALKADASQSPEALKDAKTRLQETTDAQIKDKLSDDQKSLYDSVIAERPKEETMAPTTPVITPTQSDQQPTQPTETTDPTNPGQTTDPGQGTTLGQPTEPVGQ